MSGNRYLELFAVNAAYHTHKPAFALDVTVSHSLVSWKGDMDQHRGISDRAYPGSPFNIKTCFTTFTAPDPRVLSVE